MTPRRREQPSLAALERVAAESAVAAVLARAQRDRLAAAVSGSVEGVIVVDVDGIEVYRNRAAARYRHARHADAVAERTIASLLERALAGECCEEDLRLFGPPPVILRLRALPLIEGDTRLGAAVLVHDVSDLERVESVRRDFVANVSHELKTPIGGLQLLAETLLAETDPAVIRPLAERLVGEAERLAQIVDDLLDLTAIESEQSPRRESVTVSSLLESALERMRPVAAARHIDIRVENDAEGFTILCDGRQVISAIANLLDNAVKYSDEGTRVAVTAKVRDGVVELAVRDHGIGIPSRDLERIFERLYRVDQARSRESGGTGLGLAIVRHIVESHQGSVSVESIEGEGSTFTLMLPMDGDGSRAKAARTERNA
jgi:two-component system, OmpR family, sensor histidine kinase SenX3